MKDIDVGDGSWWNISQNYREGTLVMFYKIK